MNKWGNPNGTPRIDEQAYDAMLNRLYNQFVRAGVGVYMGEFGCVRRADPKDEEVRLYYLQYVCKAMATRKIAALYWDNGNAKYGADGFGVMNHATGHYLNNGEEVVRTLTDAYNSASKIK